MRRSVRMQGALRTLISTVRCPCHYYSDLDHALRNLVIT